MARLEGRGRSPWPIDAFPRNAATRSALAWLASALIPPGSRHLRSRCDDRIFTGFPGCAWCVGDWPAAHYFAPRSSIGLPRNTPVFLAEQPGTCSLATGAEAVG